MFRPRVIPILLLKNLGLVKSVKFKKYNYIGDPINAVKIFNDLKTDELVFLDITANRENRKISLDFVRNVGAEANMPFGVGGGIKTVNDIREIINAGAEKVILNTYAFERPDFVKEAVNEFGSSTIVVSIDVKKTIFGGKKVFVKSGKQKTKYSPIEYALMIEQLGAGEIIINSIDQDGTMEGFDIDLIREISESVTIPVVAAGGAGTTDDLSDAVNNGNATAVAAGSMFVYHGPRRAVLINYPTKEELLRL